MASQLGVHCFCAWAHVLYSILECVVLNTSFIKFVLCYACVVLNVWRTQCSEITTMPFQRRIKPSRLISIETIRDETSFYAMVELFLSIPIESQCCQSYGVCGAQFESDVTFDE